MSVFCGREYLCLLHSEKFVDFNRLSTGNSYYVMCVWGETYVCLQRELRFLCFADRASQYNLSN